MSSDDPRPRDVQFAPRAAKDLRKLDARAQRRVLAALERLALDDPSVDVRRVVNTNHLRLRVGDQRVLFRTDKEHGTILVGRVLPRGRAYDR